MRIVLTALLLVFSASLARPGEAAELLMFEEPGCVWCQRWHAEVGPGYGQSKEGRIAPLRRLDIRSGVPPDIRFDQPVTLTPTFVLVEHGEEKGRLLGYPGAHFFYPMLTELLKRLAPVVRETRNTTMSASP